MQNSCNFMPINSCPSDKVGASAWGRRPKIPEAQWWSAQHRRTKVCSHSYITPPLTQSEGGERVVFHGWVTAARLKGANVTPHFLIRLHLLEAQMPHCGYMHLCPAPLQSTAAALTCNDVRPVHKHWLFTQQPAQTFTKHSWQLAYC